MKKLHFKALYIVAILVLLLVAGGGYYAITRVQYAAVGEITDFSSCVSAGFPVMESYPRQCRTSDGRNFVEQITENSLSDLIVVNSPKPGDTVTSPLIITGIARGSWFFEASFPVELLDSSGNILATDIAQLDCEECTWMTTEFVPFAASVKFSAGSSITSAKLVLKKDNPSGLPEYDAQIEIPLTLKTSGAAAAGPCYVGGCSSQVCSDRDDVVTTCEFRAEYACYQKAICERQLNGQCGWTPTTALTQCLKNPPPL